MEARALLRLLASLLVATFVLFGVASSARAAEGTMRLRVDWDALAGSLAELRGGTTSEASRARVVEAERSPWLGGRPLLVSLVARNWEGASRLAGGPMPATDAIRVSRSSRMLVGRVGWTLGAIVPYAHMGVGQWRDPDPHALGAPLEYAAQLGAGVELASAARSWAVAVEYDWTRVYGEGRDVQARAERMMGWGEAFAVVRFEIDRLAR